MKPLNTTTNTIKYYKLLVHFLNELTKTTKYYNSKLLSDTVDNNHQVLQLFKTTKSYKKGSIRSADKYLYWLRVSPKPFNYTLYFFTFFTYLSFTVAYSKNESKNGTSFKIALKSIIFE